MAKYITVICKVKGQTILKLIDDFESAEDNVFYHSDAPTEDHSLKEFDLDLIKEEAIEEGVDSLNQFNQNSCDTQESDYFDETKTFSHYWDGVKSEDNKSMDSYKKYMSVIKKRGPQMFLCKYPGCEYQTLWKNAVINHIRSHHLFFFPFICGYADCGKKFAIRSNLNNHRKVHSKRSAFGGVLSQDESSQSSLDHNYSQSVVKRRGSVLTQESKQSLTGDKQTSISQNINKNIKKKSFGKLKSKQTKVTNIKRNTSIDEKTNRSVSDDVRFSSAQTPAFVGIKSVAKFIKQTERNGKIWRQCLFEKCGYGTTYATSMVYHIRNNHLNDKPFVCPLCGKRFAMRTNLNNHKKVHKTAKL